MLFALSSKARASHDSPPPSEVVQKKTWSSRPASVPHGSIPAAAAQVRSYSVRALTNPRQRGDRSGCRLCSSLPDTTIDRPLHWVHDAPAVVKPPSYRQGGSGWIGEDQLFFSQKPLYRHRRMLPQSFPVPGEWGGQLTFDCSFTLGRRSPCSPSPCARSTAHPFSEELFQRREERMRVVLVARRIGVSTCRSVDGWKGPGVVIEPLKPGRFDAGL